MFKCIFLNENVWIPIEISLKFVPKDSIDNNPALFQTMAWRRPGDKPLFEPMMVRLPTHICVTRPQWVEWLLGMATLIKATVGLQLSALNDETICWIFLLVPSAAIVSNYRISINKQSIGDTTVFPYLYSDVTCVLWRLKSLAPRQLVQTDNKENIKTPHRWQFVKRSHWNSHHKGPVIGKAFPCHHTVMAKGWIG